LIEFGYVEEDKPNTEDYNSQANYELQMKALLVRFLNENSMQEITDQATDTQPSISQ
jgi:hypothetical protein